VRILLTLGRNLGLGLYGATLVPLIKSVNASRSVNELLLARKEWMALGADLDMQIMTKGRTRLERVPAGTRDAYFFVFRMDFLFHNYLSP
jgi:hypothetical protein